MGDIHDIKWALGQVAFGATVTRPEWYGACWRLDGTDVVQVRPDAVGSEDGNHLGDKHGYYVVEIDTRDIVATDYEVVS